MERGIMPPAPIVPIIGAGPAGMSCALWLANYGLRPVIIEQEGALGGMARLSPYPNDWLLGRPAESARENAAAFVRHIQQAGVETLTGARPQQLRNGSDGTFGLDVARSGTQAAQSLACRALVIATGTRFQGEEWLDGTENARRLAAAGRVHLGPTFVGEAGADLGAHVAVVGGGDNAFDVTRMIAEKGVKVTLVMRGSTPRARPRLVEQLRGHEAAGRATILAGRTVAGLADAVGRVRVRLSDGGGIEVDHVVLLFGYQPNTDAPWLAELALAQDALGYLEVDGNMETSRPGVFAVGDVANPAHPCIATAIAAGTVAAREIQRRLSTR
jgi:thioredoxin reductase (NADPH)